MSDSSPHIPIWMCDTSSDEYEESLKVRIEVLVEAYNYPDYSVCIVEGFIGWIGIEYVSLRDLEYGLRRALIPADSVFSIRDMIDSIELFEWLRELFWAFWESVDESL